MEKMTSDLNKALFGISISISHIDGGDVSGGLIKEVTVKTGAVCWYGSRPLGEKVVLRLQSVLSSSKYTVTLYRFGVSTRQGRHVSRG